MNRNRRALTFCTDELHNNRDEIAAGCNFSATKVALSCATKIAYVNGPLTWRLFVCHYS